MTAGYQEHRRCTYLQVERYVPPYTQDRILENDAHRFSSKCVLGHILYIVGDHNQAPHCYLWAALPCILRMRSCTKSCKSLSLNSSLKSKLKAGLGSREGL